MTNFTEKSEKEVSFKEIPFEEKLEAAKEILLASIPNILTTTAGLLRDVLSLYYIGHLNNSLLFAAIGFGLTWVNAFASAVIFGFAAGFGTVASQAYGARNYYKLGLLYQKVIVVITFLLFFICTFLWFIKDELMFIGFKEDLSYQISRFIRSLMLDLFLYMIFEVTRFYLIAQNIFKVPAIILLISTTLHFFWCYLFVTIMQLDLIGIGIARTITDGTSALLILLYVKIKNPCPESWFPWTKECLEDLVPFAKEIASHGSCIYMEWIAFEISTMIAGFLQDDDVLAAHAATLNYLGMNAMISLGISLATSVFVGNAAGEGLVRKTQKYAYVGVSINLLAITCCDFLLLSMRSSVAWFYTEHTNVNGLIINMLTIYCIGGMYFDLFCNALAYLLRTLGQERFVLKWFFWCYYGVGVTLSIITSIFLGYGYYGVWISLLTGCFIMMIITIFKLKGLDWSVEVNKICSGMKKKPSEERLIEMEQIETF